MVRILKLFLPIHKLQHVYTGRLIVGDISAIPSMGKFSLDMMGKKKTPLKDLVLNQRWLNTAAYPHLSQNIFVKPLSFKYLQYKIHKSYPTFFGKYSIDRNLLPPKLQRRGLVFKGKMGYYGACMMGYYGAWMMGYYDCALRVTMERVWLFFNKICCHFDHCAWCMGHTSRCQFRLQWTTIIWRW